MGKRSRKSQTGDTSEGTRNILPFETPYFIPNLIEVNVAHSLVFYVMLYDHCLSFFIWPIYCLPILDLMPSFPIWYLQTVLSANS